ncbi:DUF2442 domain-containing protein [Geomonas nitrogeniifigens]|uniref:DUF2442 domain-containing protein n=1 Tax=Geomonas diazotrophica TaxID=2843197 RepID=A0ABX8JDC6_9BACT|nr:DUF2442 domain-containing protein [Geomonas nitrogeniifigens]QWV96380.1 DUF2442 domain-containing protein [Geomonas nitrogeniifigens]QXE85447.1 DUF2442 domain-containing protein [Geomonas nitrogeniifigens]
MYPAVMEVIPEDDYILRVVFDNGETGFLDMKPLLEFGVFQKLKDRDAFKRVKVSFDTLEWDCGADLDPEYVYQKCTATEPAMKSVGPTDRPEADSAVGESGEKYGR